MPGVVQLAAYRIVQESLTNARRHAPGRDVRVRLSYLPGGLRVAIENEEAESAGGNGKTLGVGIVGMRERATALGGTFEAGPRDGWFHVAAELPYQR